MGVYLPNMEMPKDRGVFVCVLPDEKAIIQDDIVKHTTATSIPTPHGRLIDADALIASVSVEICDCNPDHFDLEDKEGYGKWMLHNGFNTGITAARVRIKDAPTVIPEEGET